MRFVISFVVAFSLIPRPVVSLGSRTGRTYRICVEACVNDDTYVECSGMFDEDVVFVPAESDDTYGVWGLDMSKWEPLRKWLPSARFITSSNGLQGLKEKCITIKNCRKEYQCRWTGFKNKNDCRNKCEK